MKHLLLFGAGLALTLSQSIKASELKTLDGHFHQKRLEALEKMDPNIISPLRSAYRDVANKSSGEDRIKAGARMGRLYIFEGDYLIPANNKKRRKALFEDCIKDADLIKPGNGVRENQPYYYVKLACLTYKSAAGSLSDKLEAKSYFGGDKDLFFRGIKVGSEYQGGGILRIASGIMTNPLARLVGLYKPNEALQYSNDALDAGPHWIDEAGLYGDVYCDNYRYKSLAYKVQGKNTEARAVIEEAIDTFEINFSDSGVTSIGYLPETQTPETKACANRLFKIWRDLQ